MENVKVKIPNLILPNTPLPFTSNIFSLQTSIRECWRDHVAFKSNDYSFKGLKFCTQDIHGSS